MQCKDACREWNESTKSILRDWRCISCQTVGLACTRQCVWFSKTKKCKSSVWRSIYGGINSSNLWRCYMFESHRLLLISRAPSLISGYQIRFLSQQLHFFRLSFFPSEIVLKMLLTLSSFHMPICCSLQQILFLAMEYSLSVQCVFIYPLSFLLTPSRKPSPLFAYFIH